MIGSDKVQINDPNISTTQTTTSQWQTYSRPKAEQGWECPRCGHINAPWVRQCDCSRDNWTITTSDLTYRPEWWKEITYSGTSPKIQLDSDTFRIHPDSTIYSRGSEYKAEDTYVNVGGTQCNKIDSDITAKNYTHPNNCHTPHYTTETISK